MTKSIQLTITILLINNSIHQIKEVNSRLLIRPSLSKRIFSCETLQNNHSQRPQVSTSIIRTPQIPLRRHILSSAYPCLFVIIRIHQLSTHSEISYLYFSLTIHQKIIRLYISMDNLLLFVKVMQALHHLIGNISHYLLRNLLHFT
jgi:hypothetical protein